MKAHLKQVILYPQTFLWMVLFSILLTVSSCEKEVKVDAPDISAIPSELKIISAEQLLNAADENEFKKEWEIFYTTYPAFAVFLRDWIYQNSPDEVDPVGRIYETFVTPDLMVDLNRAVDSVFGNQRQWTSVLDDAYRYHHYYFPLDSLSDVYTYSGMLGQPIDITPDFTAVALPMFMGRNFSAYKSVPSENLPRYMFHRLEPEYIPVRIMDAIGRTKYPPYLGDNTTLSYMLYEGKLLYYLDKVLPFAADSIKIGYTDAQIEWMNFNQADAWALILTEDLLFSSKSSDIARLTGEGPSTKGMSEDSPSKVGNWIGWQIIRAYMKRNPNMTIDQLFAQVDAQTILSESRWKPRDK